LPPASLRCRAEYQAFAKSNIFVLGQKATWAKSGLGLLYRQEQTSALAVTVSAMCPKALFLAVQNDRGRKSSIEELAKLFEDFP
jgi:hypothetical protein